MTRIVIRSFEECDMVTPSPITSTVLRLGLEQNNMNPIWYEPPEPGDTPHPVRWGKFPSQDIAKAVTQSIQSVGRSRPRLQTVRCPRCGYRRVQGSPCLCRG